MGPLSEKSDEERAHLSIDSYQVDTGARLAYDVHSPLDQTESLGIRYVPYAGRDSGSHNFDRRRKIDRHLLPLMCSK